MEVHDCLRKLAWLNDLSVTTHKCPTVKARVAPDAIIPCHMTFTPKLQAFEREGKNQFCNTAISSAHALLLVALVSGTLENSSFANSVCQFRLMLSPRTFKNSPSCANASAECLFKLGGCLEQD
eukprot:1642402-Amphidinium_carterae.1